MVFLVRALVHFLVLIFICLDFVNLKQLSKLRSSVNSSFVLFDDIDSEDSAVDVGSIKLLASPVQRLLVLEFYLQDTILCK